MGLLVMDEDPAGGSKTLTRSEAPGGYGVMVTTALGRSTTYRVGALSTGATQRTVDIDLGLCMWVRGERVRLHRINAPELSGADKPEGQEAREALRALVLGKAVVLQTFKDRREKYGRYLGELWLEQEGAAALNVNDALVQSGHARYQQY